MILLFAKHVIFTRSHILGGSPGSDIREMHGAIRAYTGSRRGRAAAQGYRRAVGRGRVKQRGDQRAA